MAVLLRLWDDSTGLCLSGREARHPGPHPASHIAHAATGRAPEERGGRVGSGGFDGAGATEKSASTTNGLAQRKMWTSAFRSCMACFAKAQAWANVANERDAIVIPTAPAQRRVSELPPPYTISTTSERPPLSTRPLEAVVRR